MAAAAEGSHPPAPPASAWVKPWYLDILDFGLGAVLFVTCIGLESTLFRGTATSVVLASIAGILALTILNLQHEILHMHGDGIVGSAEAAWLNLTSLVTGINAQQWQTHYSHHTFTGDYTGQLIQQRAVRSSHARLLMSRAGMIEVEQLIDRDLDDSLGLLRQDGVLRAIGAISTSLCGLAAILPFLITIPFFHGLMVVISIYRGPLCQFQPPAELAGSGCSNWLFLSVSSCPASLPRCRFPWVLQAFRFSTLRRPGAACRRCSLAIGLSA